MIAASGREIPWLSEESKFKHIFRERILLRDAFPLAFPAGWWQHDSHTSRRWGAMGNLDRYALLCQICQTHNFITIPALLSDCCQLSNKVCSCYFSKTTSTLQCLSCAKSHQLHQPLESPEAGPGFHILCIPPIVKEKCFHCIYLHDTAPRKQTTACRQAKPEGKSHSHCISPHGGGWLVQDFCLQNFKVPWTYNGLKSFSNVRYHYLYFEMILCSAEVFHWSVHCDWFPSRFHKENRAVRQR